MKLATLFLLLAASAASVSAQGWTPGNTFSYMPMSLAHALGHTYVTTDTFMLCVAPDTMSPAPLYYADLSWDDGTEGARRESVGFMADDYQNVGSNRIACKSFKVTPLKSAPRNIQFKITPVMPVGEPYVVAH